jgi:hypothetical protein
MRKSVYAAVLGALLAGCGRPDGHHPAQAVDTLLIAIVDTLGVEYGDTSQMFGLIRSAEWTPGGEIAVLDMNRCGVQIFSREMVETARLGRRGEAPGEFQLPGSMTVMPDGSVAVVDIVGMKVTVFAPDGSVDREIRGFTMAPPLELQGLDDSSFAAMSMTMMATDGDDGIAQGSLRLDRYSDSPEPDLTYAEYPLPAPGSVGGPDGPRFEFACTPDSRVVISEQSDTLLHVRRFAGDGTRDLEIREEYDRIPWPEEERGEALALSIMISDGSVNTEARSVPVEDEYRTICRSVQVDSLGRIWLEMTDTAESCFRVLSPEGELLFIAVPEDREALDGCTWSITPQGMLAIDANPDDWPKVLLVECVEPGR